MEKIANRLLLKTNTEYRIKSNGDYFFIQKNGENKPIICASNIASYDWMYLYENAENIEEIGLIAISEDPDYYPDGYLNINSNNDYFIDENDMIMIKDMFELEDSTVMDWINENSEEIEIFNQSVTIDADMIESMGLFEDISNSLYEECLNNEHTDIVEFFDYDDDKVVQWLKKVDQFPENVSIRNDGNVVIIDKGLEKKAESLSELIYYFMNKRINHEPILYHEIYNSIMSILSEN